MYLHKFSVSGCANMQADINFASDLEENQVKTDQLDPYAGFFVIYGERDQGKTAVLKSIACGLVGSTQANQGGESQMILLSMERGGLPPKIEVVLHFLYSHRDVNNPPRPGAGKKTWYHSAGMTFRGSRWERVRSSFTGLAVDPWANFRKYLSLSYPFNMSPSRSNGDLIATETFQSTLEDRHPLLFGVASQNPNGTRHPGRELRVFLLRHKQYWEENGYGVFSGVVLIDDFGHSMDDESIIALSEELTADYPKLQFIVTTESKALKNSFHEERRFQVRRDGDLVILERP